MGAANPAFAKKTRTWEVGASVAALNALVGDDLGLSSATLFEAYERLYCGTGDPVKLTAADFITRVTASYSVTGAWVLVRETLAEQTPDHVSSTIIANSGNFLAAAMTATGVAHYGPATPTMTFTPRSGYDYWVGVVAYAPTSHFGFYFYPQAIQNTTDGSYTYYRTATEPQAAVGTALSPRLAIMARFTFETANNLIRTISTVSIGSGKLYLLPRCTTDATTITVYGARPATTIKQQYSLSTLLAGGTLEVQGGFGLDFSGGNKHAFGMAAGVESPMELESSEAAADYQYLCCSILNDESGYQVYDVWRANDTHASAGELAAGDLVPHAMAVQDAAVGVVYGYDLKVSNIHDFLALSGNGGTSGEIQIGAQPVIVLTDSEGSASNGNFYAAIPTTWNGGRCVYTTASGGRLMTANSASRTAAFKLYEDPTGQYTRLCEVQDAIIVLHFGMNDISAVAGADGSAAEGRSLSQCISDFVGRAGHIIGLAQQNYATRNQHVIIAGPFAATAGNPSGDAWTAGQIAAVKTIDRALKMLCASAGAIYVSLIDIVPGNADGVHITATQGTAICARIAVAYEAGVAPAIPRGGGGLAIQRSETMNLEVQQSLSADNTDQPVTVPRDYMLLVNSNGAPCDVRSTAGSTSKFTIPADTPTPLGKSLGQTIYLRAATGTVIDLALI